MKIGIVGLPNVGKSTLFKALTKKQVSAENYPFCTIDPNVGVVEVPDERLDKLASLYNSAKIIHATIEFVDIAGLVKNAHKGEGLGNQFLAHIREVDAIAHVVRNFHDDNVIHVEGKIDPKNDLETIVIELAMADMATIEKALARLKDKIKGGDKEAVKLKNILEPIKVSLDAGQKPDVSNLKEDELKLIRGLGLLSLKPELYIENIDEKQLAANNKQTATDNKQLTTNNLGLPNGAIVVPICAKLEAELSELSDAESKEYLHELGIDKTGLDKLITESYRLLDLITFFTSGPKETRAWTITKGSLAPQAAGEIHTDFEKGFIRAEVVAWDKLVEAGSDFKAKEKGWVRDEGKNYVMEDGDVVVIKFAN